MTTVFSIKNLPKVRMLWFIVLFASFFIPSMLLYGFNGAEEWDNIFKFMFYEGIVLVCVISISIDQLTENRKGMKWIDTYLHNPEKGIFGSKLFYKFGGWVRNPVKLFLISYVVFGLMGTVSVISNTFFISTPEFQILPIAAIGLGAEPASSAETMLFFAVLLGLGYGLSKKIAKKNKTALVALMMISVLLVGVVAFPLYHRYKYGSDEEDMLGVMFFGLSNSALTAATGSIIPAWVWHDMNNGLHAAKEHFSKDTVVVAWGAIWFITSLMIVFVLINWKEKKKRRK